jgi:Flp pilus assembly protein TadG
MKGVFYLARRLKIFSRCEGAVALEFALVLPILALILCGIFDVGNLYYNLDLVNNAARQGARLIAVNVSSANGESLAQVTTALQSSYGNQITVTETPSNPTSGNNVTVTVTSKVPIITPIIRAFFPQNPYPVQASCTMYVE